jgi:hypothetical protein
MSVIGHSVESIKSIFAPHKAVSSFRSYNAFHSGVADGLKGSLFNAPFIGFEVGSAQRGEQLATLSGKTTGLLTYPALSGIAAAGVAMIPGINVAAAALVGSILVMYPASLLEDSVTKKVKWLNETGKRISHLELGGSYKDTSYAQRVRQQSLIELSGAHGPARRYLGQEGLINHR